MGLSGGVAAGQPPANGEHRQAAEREVVPPPGALRVLSHSRHRHRVAVCAEAPGPPIEYGTHAFRRTHVWVDDGTTVRQVGTAPGTCSPAWSPDGARLTVIAPDGLWVLSADLRVTMHLVDTRHTEAPDDEALHRQLASPAWAPDGAYLAFAVTSGDASWVEVVDALTGQLVYRSDPEVDDFAWGPDSRSLRLGARVVRVP